MSRHSVTSAVGILMLLVVFTVPVPAHAQFTGNNFFNAVKTFGRNVSAAFAAVSDAILCFGGSTFAGSGSPFCGGSSPTSGSRTTRTAPPATAPSNTNPAASVPAESEQLAVEPAAAADTEADSGSATASFFSPAGIGSGLGSWPSMPEITVTPTLSINADPPFVKRRATTQIHWKATNVKSCTVTSPNLNGKIWKGLKSPDDGKTSNPILGETPFTLSCIDSKGNTLTQTIKVLIPAGFRER